MHHIYRFQCVQMPNQILESISIIDTPGILTAAKRKLSRGEAECLLISLLVPEEINKPLLLLMLEQSDKCSRPSEVGTFQPAKFKHLKAEAKLMKAV